MTLEEAIDGLKDNRTTFEDVKAAVRTHKFPIVRSARSLDELVDMWDYTPVPGSFRDTVEKAMWRGELTREQVKELRDTAFAAKEEEQG